MRTLLDKDPYKVIYLAVKGMVPKNDLREDILKQHLIVHDGPHHDQFAFMLPHFTESAPLDINDYFGFNNLGNKDAFEIEFESDPSKRPVELKDLDVNTNPEDNIPLPLLPPSKFTDPKENLYRSQVFKSSWKHLRKYKKHN